MNYQVYLDGANEIILKYISPFSTILEFGPANGTMTQFLKDELHCNVYIVEKDSQAFESAMAFAEGGLCDDISTLKWAETFSKVRFDYIILSNVMEHLTDPESVVRHTAGLLKESGSLLIAIPNIAHNDILLNMYHNSFNYTEIGLLDKTHVHFWGYNNLAPFFAACGYSICDIQIVNHGTLSTEQTASAALYDLDFCELLKKRELGEVYQFVLKLQKDAVAGQVSNDPLPKPESIPYSTFYLDFGSGYTEMNVVHMPLAKAQAGELTLAYTLKCPSHLKGLRLDPIEGKFCIVRDLHIISNLGPITIEAANAAELNGTYYFCNTDSQLFLHNPFDDVMWINVRATIMPIDSFQSQVLLTELIQQINSKKNLYQGTARLNIRETLEVLESEYIKNQDLRDELRIKEEVNQKNLCLLQEQKNKIEIQSQYIGKLEQYIYELKHSTCWKITKPIRAVGEIGKSFLKINSAAERDAEKPYVYNIENYCVKGNSLSVAGWIAINEKLADHVRLEFLAENTKECMGAVSLPLADRKDVQSAYSETYVFAYGFCSEIFITTKTKVIARLCFITEHETYTFAIGTIAPMRNATAFQCMISSDARGKTELKKWAALFQEQESIPTDVYGESFDIIIPIYNGFHYLETLFSSLSKTKCHYRLILVNDHSSDRRVAEYLAQYRASHSNVIVIENSKNLGFVQSVNEALTIAENHVVLLNTDIELPENWLERLMAPIISDPQIATTTPFTNSGTICSFPFLGEDNELFDNLSVNTIDSYFKYLVPNFQMIPTGVGFCMGMNIHALKKVGLLDAETFSRGYGEENDWCQRAISEGFYNVHVNHLFVSHKHGGSFPSEQKKALLQRNIKLLEKKHPLYHTNVALYCAVDPMRETRESVLALLILLECNGKNTIAFNHDLGGGANYYLEKKRREAVRQGEKFIIIKYGVRTCRYTISICYKDYILDFEAVSYLDIQNFLMKIPFTEIWINELVSYPDLYDLLDNLARIRKEKKIELIMLLHDLFFACPAINPLNEKDEFCAFPSLKKCEECAKKSKDNHCPDYISVEEYRNHWRNFLGNCTQIIAFSNSTLKWFEHVYGSMSTLKLIPHEVDFLPSLDKKRKSTPSFNIGLLGVLNFHKGLSVIKELLSLIDHNGLNIKIILIGTCEETINSEHFYVHGKYSREELPKLVSQLDIDIFFISSLLPETFSYTTAEIMSLHYPIASFNIGAPAERIAAYDKGLIINSKSPQNILNQFLRYKEEHLHFSYSAKKVLFVIEEISFASRYRVEHVREKMAYSGVASDVVMMEEMDSLVLYQYEKIILYRISDYKKTKILQMRAHELNIPIIYDIDDYIFDYSQIQGLPFLCKAEYCDFENYCMNIQKAMAFCDSYITSTESLKHAILNTAAFEGKSVEVKRNMASAEMFCLSDLAWKNREFKLTKQDIWLGYFSGSKTHDDDFGCISDVLLTLLERYDNLYLKIGGCLEMPPAFEKYQKRIRRFPFKSWKELPEEIASVDINLMPLADTFFNQCKSENKWMEAGLVKVPTVSSYNDELALVINGKNGILCRNAEEWLEALISLIDAPDFRNEIGNQAYLDVLAAYTTWKRGQTF